MTGRVVDSLEISERFLWDLRQTVSDLLVENYAGHFRELANRHGMRLSIEAYDDCPCDQLTYAGQADEPMAEFWSWQKFGEAFSCTEMSSAAHVYGKRILGAEAFTANDAEKWQGHPGDIKDLGDWAFCEGINRFVFHRYAMQPWLDRKPGMSMGPWGLHYERTETWWEHSAAWHDVSGPLPVPPAAGAFRGGHLLPGAGRLARAVHPADQRAARRRGARHVQLRRLSAGGAPDAHDGEGRPARPARRHELPDAGAARRRDHDAAAVGQDQGADRGRGDGSRSPRPSNRRA